MLQTSFIKGHFDGRAVVLDEPASLAVGQAVRVVVDTQVDDAGAAAPVASSGPGSWKGRLCVIEERDDVVIEHFKEYLP